MCIQPKDEIKVHSACMVSEACYRKLRLESHWDQRIPWFKNNALPLCVHRVFVGILLLYFCSLAFCYVTRVISKAV